MTNSEENYLKTIYHLSLLSPQGVSTNSIANSISSKASSVTDMAQKLAEKGLVTYKKYQGVTLTPQGKSVAISVIRKHRLWEVFLVEKLGFSWDEVHDIAEQLEHINSEKLTDKLDSFLGFPSEDPHGDPIPDKNGKLPHLKRQLLSDAPQNTELICVGVKDSSPAFLQYLDKQKISLGTSIKILEKENFDHSLRLHIGGQEIVVSQVISSNIFVK